MWNKIIKPLVIISLTIGMGLNAYAKDKLYVYNWTEYVPNELLNKFTDETGIEVVYTTFESNEEMYSKLKLTQGGGYDLVFPSSYYVQKMAKENLIQPLDKSKLQNIANISEDLLHKEFDPENKFSLPYAYGLTGILVNKAAISQEITSWSDLWNPEFKNQVLLMNDSREVFHISLLLKGLSPNTTNENDIKSAFEYLEKLIPNVQAFNSDSPEVPYVQEEVNIGMSWNGSSYRGIQANPNLQFIYPKEGAILWIDCIALTKNAKNIDAAYKFINFLLKPENAKVVLEKNGFSMANNKLKEVVSSEEANNPVLFPSKENIEKSVLQQDVGSAIDIYEKYWNKLRTMNQ